MTRLFLITLALLGSMPSLSHAESAQKPDSVCVFIADKVGQQLWPASKVGDLKQNYMVHFGVFDIDRDGQSEVISPGITGTAGGEGSRIVHRTKAGEETPAEYGVPSDSKELWLWEEQGRWDYGQAWFPYENRWYEVGFSDEAGAFPSVVRYYEPGRFRIACGFENDVEEFPTKGYLDPGARVAPIEPSSFEQARISPSEYVSANVQNAVYAELKTYEPKFEPLNAALYPSCSGDEKSCRNVWRVDFDNNGVEERLLKIQASSGAGRGCGMEYFVAITPDNRLDMSVVQKKLSALQGLDFSDRYPARPCGLEFGWLKINGKTYFERRAHEGKPKMTANLAHELWALKDDTRALVWQAQFRIHPKVAFEKLPSD